MDKKVKVERHALTMQEVCEMAGCERTTLYREAHKGNLIIRKMGRKSFILRDDVFKWLNCLPLAHFDNSKIDRPDGSVICRVGEPVEQNSD